MVIGAACQWRTRAELRRAIGDAPVLRRADVHASEALRITRVATGRVGAYFIVTEADSLFSEDYAALQDLDEELMASWRNRVVETRDYAHPHKWFPLSRWFRVHLVHPAHSSEWEAHDDEQVYSGGGYDPLRKSSRAVSRQVSEAI